MRMSQYVIAYVINVLPCNVIYWKNQKYYINILKVRGSKKKYSDWWAKYVCILLTNFNIMLILRLNATKNIVDQKLFFQLNNI